MVVEIEIDYKKCKFCKACVNACSYGVLEWLDDRPIIVNATNCVACLECVKSCHTNAISIEEK